MKRLLFVSLTVFYCSFSYAQTFYQQTPAAQRWVDSVFKKLSKKQRIAQLFVIRESSRDGNGNPVFFDSTVTSYIKKYNVGALCLFQGNPAQQAAYINRYQTLAKTPLMISIDGEMGLGMRMTDSVMKFPDNITLGAVNDAGVVYRIGQAIGRQCKREGIEVDYAPVVDINNNPNNPVIGFRSFGEDKYKVALMGTQMMKGIQSQGVMATAKHFPGHGDVSVDSHLDLPVINKSMQELDTLELYPFKQLFKEGVGAVMIAHLSIPAIDTTTHLPTSLSPKNVTALLRDSLGFKGISFTDALEMQGVAKYYPGSDGALQSLIAGNDMLCLPGDVDGSIDRISKAIKKGVLNEDEMNARVKKVLLAKYHLGLNHVKPVNVANLSTDLNAEVPALRKEVAENALTLLRLKQPGLLPLKANMSVAYVGLGVTTQNTLAGLLQQSYHADTYLFGYKDDEAKADSIYHALLGKYDVVIVGLHKYNKYPAGNFGISDAAVDLAKRIRQSMPTVTMVFGNPYAVKYVDAAPNLVACYEDDAIFQQAAFDWLQGNFFAKGSLPVTVSADFSYGYGIADSTVLPVATPESQGMNSEILSRIDSIANDAIAKRATPGCVVLVAKNGKVVFDKAYGYMTYDSIQPVTATTVYDLASVTKISATTVSLMKLYDEGKLDIHKTLGDYLPWVRGTDKAHLTIENIILHQAGLNAFIPFYRETIDSLTGIPKPGFYRATPDSLYSVRVAEDMYMRRDWIDTMFKRILDSKLGPSNKYVYSDNDFIFMGKLVQQLTGMPLNEYVKQTFYKPLNMESTTFKPREHEPLDKVAPTEMEKYFRLQQIRGDVHDPGSAMFGGVAGHAGLFSDAYDLAKLYQMLLNGGELDGKRYIKKSTIDYFTAYHSEVSRRGLGFDKPEKDNATRKPEDAYPAPNVSPLTYGHTGFTGICVWVDPEYNLLYIFMSNRVNPDGGENLKLSHMNVRSNIQEAIYASFGH
ncbi:MAG TPA: glycoside hydrolase family 3 N-terminal domain-containing protein [Chitinophagaceae bacterium]|nr:glycoside hydrolase family 3 N-terminal domain-containing protein [Chitinophagaceae bacterium]